MRCLPPERKGDFMVADRIHGFHPKAVIWKEDDEQFFAVVGSSNQTEAAFESNYEANVFCSLSQADYLAAKKWVRQIEQDSVGISEDWLKKYKEAPLGGGRFLKGSKKNELSNAPVSAFPLPHPRNIGQLIRDRRAQLEAYKENQEGLIGLFRRCADGEITSPQFYEELPDYWGYEKGDRLTGKGFAISAKHSDFQALSLSFLKIIDAADEDRDDIVRKEIDRLHDLGVPTRKAFLSEMICLMFPDRYPVWNGPVREYLRHVGFTAPRGASEGVCFVDLTKKLRVSIHENRDHPAKNLAELDLVIWKWAELRSRRH
jgi:hypothetical protein